MRLPEAYRGTPEAIGQLLIPMPGGGRIPLAQMARVNIVEGPETIEHEDGQRYAVVLSNVRGRDLGSFVSDVRREITQKVTLPSGYFVTYGGQFENQDRAMRRLGLIVPLVLLLILGFLYASFGNGRQALLVLLNVPFALVGWIASLWLRDLISVSAPRSASSRCLASPS